jgi:hypothetical protein
MLVNVVRLHKQLEYKKLPPQAAGSAPAPAEPSLPDEAALGQLEEKLIYIYSKTSHTSPANAANSAVSASSPATGTSQ